MSSKPVSHRATTTRMTTAPPKTTTLDRRSGGAKLTPELGKL
jgi:hypothetical protein